jgi:hypothetical protein
MASAGAVPPADWSALGAHVTGTVRLAPGVSRRWPAHFDSLGSYGRLLRRLPTALSLTDLPPPLAPAEALERLRVAGVEVG